MIAVDGKITEGASSIDESFVTGEPFPVYKKAGSFVTSGTLNLTAPLQVTAEKNGDDSFMAVIAQEIEAKSSKLICRRNRNYWNWLLQLNPALTILFLVLSLHMPKHRV